MISSRVGNPARLLLRQRHGILEHQPVGEPFTSTDAVTSSFRQATKKNRILLLPVPWSVVSANASSPRAGFEGLPAETFATSSGANSGE